MSPRRHLISLLLFTANYGSDGGCYPAVGLPAAHAFVSPVQPRSKKKKYASIIATNRRGQPPRVSESALWMENSSSSDAPSSKGVLLPTATLASLSLVTLAAFTQHLPGPLIDATAPPLFFGTLPFGVFFSGSCDPYSSSLIFRDVASTMLCIAGAAVFVKSITSQVSLGNIESRDSRKIIHTLSAPLFILLWPMFSNAFGARVFATIVPLLNALRLYAAGTGGHKQSTSESELAGAISRSGDAEEALGGPFIYVMVLIFTTFFFWTDSPIGIVSVATMAVGDGLADLVGRRLGSSNKWSFNKSKSMAGSAAFVVGSFVGSYGLLFWLTSLGAMEPLEMSAIGIAGRLLAIAFVSAGVELIPVVDDNWSVPLSAALLSAFLLQ